MSKQFRCIIFFVIILLISCGTNEKMPPGSKERYSRKVLIQDFDQFVEAVNRSSPKAFTDTFKLTEVISSQRAKITDMSEYEFFQILAPVISAVDCGHTSIEYQYSSPKDHRRYFPLGIKVIDTNLFLYENSTDMNIPEGSLIHSINQIDSSDIIETLYSSMSSDGENITIKQLYLNHHFSSLYNNYIEAPEEFILTYTNPGETELRNISIKPISWAKTIQRESFLLTGFSENYAVLRVGTFITGRMTVDIDNFFSDLKDKSIKTLIVDLRGNSGGDPEEGDKLLSYLLNEPYQYFSDGTKYYPELVQNKSEIKENAFDGDLYVIIDGGCFSTTGHVLSHIKDKSSAVIVGRESGGGYVCNGNPIPVSLNNTGIRLNISQGVFATTVKSLVKGRGIMPDIQIDYTIDDYLSAKDLEFETILGLINNKSKGM